MTMNEIETLSDIVNCLTRTERAVITRALEHYVNSWPTDYSPVMQTARAMLAEFRSNKS